MTAEPLDTTTTEPLPKRKAYAVERPRFPLVFKLFGMTAILILLVVGIATAITIDRANRIAGETVKASIHNAANLFKEFERQRLGLLSLGAEVTAQESTFAAYIQHAISSAPAGPDVVAPPVAGAPPPPPPAAVINYADILDQAQQRKEQLGSDLIIITDDQGHVLARTDAPTVTGDRMEDAYQSIPLLRKVIEDQLPVATGVTVTGDRLYHAAIVPIAPGGTVRIGYIMNAYAIDDAFANRISESTNAAVMFVPSPNVTSHPSIARSSNAPSVSMEQLTGLSSIFQSGREIPPKDMVIDRSAYVMTAQPLQSLKQTVGAAVFIRSLDKELAPFRQIQKALFVGGGGALLLAFLLSWIMAKRMTRPIEELAGLAQAVTAGDYDVHPAIERSDEVGILGRSFAKMITSLRDKSELEELYEQMAARSAEREALSVRPQEQPLLDEGTILVTDLRGLPATVGDGDASAVISTISRVMRLQEGEVVRQDGMVREIVGHRLVSVFRGERGIIHAIRAARAINEELATQTDLKPPMSIGVGIATGEFVTGSVTLAAESGLAMVGNAPLLALLFAWHAPSGAAYISYETAQAAGDEILASSTREEVRLKWLAQPLPVAAISLAGMTTSVMRAMGGTTGMMATLKLDGTVPGATAPSNAVAELAQGQLFAGRYKIDSIIGRGGMGVVYRANDTQLDEVVAIKTLPGDVMTRSPEDLERFKREIRLARKITHRNVLRTYDYGEADGVYFISMEFVRGYTLNELLDEAQSRQVAPRVAMGIGRQISRGLQAAHEQGIIHRDIKPGNVLIDHKGEVKLMDFGIARMAEAPEAMTQAGLIVGTPHYMSPEQVQGKQLDPRSDVYSMGVMIYEMVVGRRPFESSTLTGV
ncbi:MAG: protein kinase, partial [Acidobacteria bacterium]|nr:protein kinase [Acidobacteriota bacterium]